MSDRAAPAGGVPATDEIEITSEMIEAGVDELYCFDITEPRLNEMRIAVAAIFRRMSKVAAKTLLEARRPV